MSYHYGRNMHTVLTYSVAFSLIRKQHIVHWKFMQIFVILLFTSLSLTLTNSTSLHSVQLAGMDCLVLGQAQIHCATLWKHVGSFWQIKAASVDGPHILHSISIPAVEQYDKERCSSAGELPQLLVYGAFVLFYNQSLTLALPPPFRLLIKASPSSKFQ